MNTSNLPPEYNYMTILFLDLINKIHKYFILPTDITIHNIAIQSVERKLFC